MDDWSTQDGVERGRDVGLYEEEEDFLVRNCEEGRANDGRGGIGPDLTVIIRNLCK
jgi:hypothetical protein